MEFKRLLFRFRFAPIATFHFCASRCWSKMVHRNPQKRGMKCSFAYQYYRAAITRKLRRLYRKDVDFLKDKVERDAKSLSHEKSNKIWIYWAQGFENAPAIVQACVQSIEKMGGGIEVILLSDNNIGDYVTFPDYILKKYKCGAITRTFFSDLLRLNLLVRHGGTWIDSTIFYSGAPVPSYMLDSELFLFQTDPMESGMQPTRIENYFISAHKNNKLLTVWLELLYRYWAKYPYAVNYFLSYEMFELVIEAMPNEWSKVVYYPRASVLTLAKELCQPYDPKQINILLERFPFHKLSYKLNYKEGSGFDFLLKYGFLNGKESC